MKIQYNVGNDAAPWDLMMFPMGLALVYYVVLFAFMYRILTRSDFDTLNRILWVLVVVLVPVLGFVLYLVTAPASPVTARHRIVPGSDVSGTPWSGDPNFTKNA